MDYDMIQIQIEAEAQKANSSVDALVNKLNKLSNSLTSVGGAPMYNLASGVDRLGVSMQQVSAVRTAEFSRLSRNIEKISSINAGQIIYSATAINSLGESIEKMGVSSANAQGIADIAGNISKLGNKGVQNAVTNIPLLATSLNELMVVLSNSPAVNQNLIDMTNALANLASQGSKVGTASNTLVNGMNRTSTAMQRTRTNTFSLASAFGKFYASYFLVIRGIKGLWTSIESTADYIEAFNYFNVAFGKVASEWSDNWEDYGKENAQAYADSFTERINKTLGKLSGINVKVSADGEGLLTSTNMKNLGLNIQEVTQYASQLASVTNSVGQTGETTLAVSDSFTKLAGDISSLFNVDYESVAKNLQSGLIGQSRALYKYGIDITNATLQTYAYAMGIEKSVSEMTQAEKMQLRYIAILDQSKVAFGDLANTINSPSNMIRQLSTNLKEAGMVLGQLFIPFLEKTLPKLNGFAIAIKNVLVDIAGILGIEIDFSEFGQGYDESMDNMDGITDSLEGVEESAKKANKAIRSFDELLVIGSSSAVGGDAAESTLDLTKEILDASAEYNRVWNKAFEEMESKSQAFASSTEKYFEPIKDFVRAIKEKDITDLGDGLGGLFDVLVDFGSRITGIDETGISAFSGAVLSMFTTFITYKTISTTITKISNAIGLIAAHPYASLAIGISGVFGALAGWSVSEDKRKQIEDFGFTLDDLLTVAQEAKDFTSSSDIDFSNMKFGNTKQIKSLSDRYFELFKKQNLSKEEMKEMGYLYDTLSEKLPGFKDIIADETLSYEQQKKAVSGLISELEKSYKVKAAEDMLVGLYEQQITVENALKDALEVEKKYNAEYNRLYSMPGQGRDKQYNYATLQAKRLRDEAREAIEELEKSKKLIEEEITSVYNSIQSILYEPEKEKKKKFKSEEQLIGLFAGIDLSSPSVKRELERLEKEAKDTAEKNGQSVSSAFSTGIKSQNEIINNAVKELVEEAISNFDPSNSNTKEEIKTTVSNFGMELISNLESMLPSFFNTGASIAKEINKGFQSVQSSKEKMKVVASIGGVGIQRYATGGFLEDGLFTMNRGEIAGRFNNGSSVVANNRQITDGIANAVYPAVYRAMSDALTNQHTNVNVTLEGDANGLFKAVQKKANEYFGATGNSAFLY